MTNKSPDLATAKKELENAINLTNTKITELSPCAEQLNTIINNLQEIFDKIRNVPSEQKVQYEIIKKQRLRWKNEAEQIAQKFKEDQINVAGKGSVGAGMGLAVVALGPSAAMGIATTFGVASTGTAISALSGAAATNAALAWLGGGTLAAGGGGIAAGSSFLALAGPVGWTIAGIAILTSGILYYSINADKKRLNKIFANIYKRDQKTYELATVELDERINTIRKSRAKLFDAITKAKTFGTNYDEMTEEQQYLLGSYVNLMESSTWLLTEPILGLLPKFTEEDFTILCNKKTSYKPYKKLIITLSNLLFKIKLDKDDTNLLYQCLKSNDKFLSSINMTKDSFELKHFNIIEDALNYRYQLRD